MSSSHSNIRTSISNPLQGIKASLFSVVVNSILFGLSFLFFDASFNTNDDVGQMMELLGITRVAESSPYLTYSHISIGMFLQKLYAITESIMWYPLFLLAAVFIAHVVVLQRIFKGSALLEGLIFYGAYFVFIGSTFALQLQFSLSSALISAAGLLLYFHQKSEKYSILFGAILFAIGLMIRTETSILIGLLVGIYFFGRMIFEQFKHWQSFLLKVMGILLLFVFVGKSNDLLRSGDQEWEDFYAFQAVRGKLSGNKPLDGLPFEKRKKILQEIDWTVNDYLLLNTFFFIEPTIFSTENLEHVLKNAPSVKRVSLDYMIVELKKMSSNPISIYLLFFFCFFLLYAIGRKRRLLEVTALFVLLSSLLLAIAFSYRWPPFRVYAGLYGSVLFLLFYDFHPVDSIRKWKGSFKYFFIIGCIALSFIRFNELSTEATLLEERNKELHALVKDLSKSQEDKLFINWGSAFPWENILPFESINFMKELDIFSLGSLQRSPSSLGLLEKHDIQDLSTFLGESDNAMLLVRTKQRIESLQVYLAEHFDLYVEYEHLNTYGKLQVYKLSSSVQNSDRENHE